MEKRIALAAHTNADDNTPEYALFCPIELDNLLEKALTILNWDDTSLKYVAIEHDVECEFLDVDGSVNDNYSRWSQSVLKVNQYGVSIVFEHQDSGHELFFTYDTKLKEALQNKVDCPNCNDHLEYETAPGIFVRNKYLCGNCGCELTIPEYQSMQRKQPTEQQ